jgi:hypothetical protein
MMLVMEKILGIAAGQDIIVQTTAFANKLGLAQPTTSQFQQLLLQVARGQDGVPLVFVVWLPKRMKKEIVSMIKMS